MACEGEALTNTRPVGAAQASPAPDFPSAARMAAVVAGAAVSLVLFVSQLLLGRDVASFLGSNDLEAAARNAQLGAVGAITLVVFPAALVISRRRPEVIERSARVLAPVLLAAAVPLLFGRDAWKGQELAFLVFAGAFGLLLEALLLPAFQALGVAWSSAVARLERGPVLRAGEWVLVVAAIAYYVFRTGTLVTLSHERMATSTSDLAEFDNLFFNALNGHPFRAPAIEGQLGDWTALKVHAEFLLYLLLPFYALSPGPEALLWIQTVVVASTALPLYLFARDRLGIGGGLAVAVAYLCCPAVQRPNFYDFHFTPAGMLCIAWWIWSANRLARAAERGHALRGIRLLGPFFAFAGLVLLSREDTALGFGVACLGLALFGVLPRFTVPLAVAAGLYFVVMKFGIMAQFGRGWFDTIYDDLKAPDAKGFHAVIVTLVTNPAFVIRKLLTEPKLLYLLHMSVPVLFLWWRRAPLVLAAVPALPFTLLVTNRAPMFESSFQYTYHWIPYVFAASVLALEWLGRQGSARKAAAAAAMVAVAVASNVQLGALFGGANIVGGFGPKALSISGPERERSAHLERLVEQVPPSASVAATEAEGPHVSTRLVFYSLKFTLGEDPDYLLVGNVGLRGETDHVREALSSERYGLAARSGPFFLLERGADPTANPALLREILRRR